jgi:splicing factor 3B subunit 1
MFEYIGEMSKDYIYAVTPLLEDALIDRDQVHRQTAAMAVKNMALGVVGFGCEEALLHLVNSIIPNVFDANPHLITAVIESMDAVRLSVGPCIVFQYVVQVRFILWMVFILRVSFILLGVSAIFIGRYITICTLRPKML